jgi:hypothetical protein
MNANVFETTSCREMPCLCFPSYTHRERSLVLVFCCHHYRDKKLIGWIGDCVLATSRGATGEAHDSKNVTLGRYLGTSPWLRVLGFPFLRVLFPKNVNPFSNPFLWMFLRWLKLHTYCYYLFAEISYGFPCSCVPRNGEPAWISRPRGFIALVPKSRNPEPIVEFAVPGSRERKPETDTPNSGCELNAILSGTLHRQPHILTHPTIPTRTRRPKITFLDDVSG